MFQMDPRETKAPLKKDGILMTRRRGSAIHHLRRPYELPGRILARAFPCGCFATARARGNFHVVWQRPLDAAAFGTIQTMEMIKLTGFMHGSLPHDMLTSITAFVDAPPQPCKALRGSAGAWPASPPTGRRGPRHDPGRRARRCS